MWGDLRVLLCEESSLCSHAVRPDYTELKTTRCPRPSKEETEAARENTPFRPCLRVIGVAVPQWPR